MRPFFRVMHGAVNLIDLIGQQNISLTITEGTGENADTAQFTIDDKDGLINPFHEGQEIQILAGYTDDFRDFGTFKVDEVVLSGWPQEISVNAQSVGARTAAKERRPKNYEPERGHDTYGKIFEEIAGRTGLTLAMSAKLKSLAVEYEAQAEENDLEFATRLGEKIGAHVTVKNGRLVVTARAGGVSASGEPLPFIYVVNGRNVTSYSASIKDKPRYSEVKARWFDRETKDLKEVTESASDDGPSFIIRSPFQSEEDATNAAKTKASDLKRGTGSATFEIDGDPQAQAGALVIAVGIRSGVDGLWKTTTITHSWSGTGPYSTSVQCEITEDGSSSGAAAP